LKQQAEAIIRNEVKKVLQGTNEFDLIEVASNLSVNFAETERTEIEYTPADGQMQGVLSHESSYEAETDGGTAMVPGTDSNGDDTYVWSQGEGGSSSVSQFEKDYLPNSETTIEKIPAGSIIYNAPFNQLFRHPHRNGTHDDNGGRTVVGNIFGLRTPRCADNGAFALCV